MLADDLRAVLRLALRRAEERSPAVLDSRTLHSTPESGMRGAYDGAKHDKGSKLHLAVHTLGNLLALHVTPASIDERVEVDLLAKTMRAVSSGNVEVAFCRSWIHRSKGANADEANGVELVVVRLPEAKKGRVMVPRRLGGERFFAWATRFRRLIRDCERYATMLVRLHLAAFICLMLKRAALLAAGS